MSTIRDSTYPAPSRYRKSPPNLNAHSGAYNPSQGARLPPLSSAFAGPYSGPLFHVLLVSAIHLCLFLILKDSQHETLSSRMSPSRNSEAFAPSFQPTYWSSNNGRTSLLFLQNYLVFLIIVRRTQIRRWLAILLIITLSTISNHDTKHRRLHTQAHYASPQEYPLTKRICGVRRPFLSPNLEMRLGRAMNILILHTQPVSALTLSDQRRQALILLLIHLIMTPSITER